MAEWQPIMVVGSSKADSQPEAAIVSARCSGLLARPEESTFKLKGH